MNERRLHPFTVLRFLRKTLVVYLLPLVQVLFERNWTALHTALRQDALLVLLLCAVSWGILRVSSWSMDDTGVFHLYWRLGIRLDRALRGEMLAALTIDRPLLYRMAGASRLTLYPVGAAQKHTLSVCLPKADAEAVADQVYFGDAGKKDDAPTTFGGMSYPNNDDFQELPDDDGKLPF